MLFGKKCYEMDQIMKEFSMYFYMHTINNQSKIILYNRNIKQIIYGNIMEFR
jgi:hypothetical protein